MLDVQEGTEFLIVIAWKSAEAISKFAGENIDVAVVPAFVQQMMVTYDKTVIHHQIASSYAGE